MGRAVSVERDVIAVIFPGHIIFAVGEAFFQGNQHGSHRHRHEPSERGEGVGSLKSAVSRMLGSGTGGSGRPFNHRQPQQGSTITNHRLGYRTEIGTTGFKPLE